MAKIRKSLRRAGHRIPSRAVRRPRKRGRGAPARGATTKPAGRIPPFNWRAALELSPGVWFRQRPDWTFVLASPRIEVLTGLTVGAWQRAPSRFWDVVHELDAPELEQQIRQAADAPTPITSTYRIRNVQDGRLIYVHEIRRPVLNARGKVVAYDGIWLDITRQNIAEIRLANAAWKETLAVLTMGLAHDFNNILAGICSLSDTFLLQLEAGHPFQEGLALITHNARQASELVHRIVNLHRGKTGTRSYHNLNEVATEVVELLRKVVPRRIEVTSDVLVNVPLFVDAVEFRQVIINLALNAVDAMPNKGKLRLHTAAHAQLPEMPHFKGTIPRVPCSALAVTDTGCGINPEHLESIFDPFFTTKAMNKGSGLGLYNAKLFVEKHHGCISVESTEGVGTTFRIWLPQADFTEAEDAEAKDSQRRRTLMVVGKPGKTLDGMAEFLRLRNFQVFAVSQRPEQWLQSAHGTVDGVILQMMAQDPAGPALLRTLREIQAAAKFIVQPLGCHQDQLDTQFLLRADLTITPDMAEESIIQKIHGLFEMPA